MRGIFLPGCITLNVFSANHPANSFIRILIIVLLFFFKFQQQAFALIINSDANGYWASGSTWEEGIAPSVSDDVVINTTVTIQTGTVVEINTLTITQNGNLIIYGTLIVNGNLFMDNNGSELTASMGASVIIMGDATLGNRVSIALSSYFIVKGDFFRDGASTQGSISVAGAHIYIFGSFSSSWTNFTACDEGSYDGTTNTVGDNCDVGKTEDFVEHVEPEDLPEDIYYQLVVTENTFNVYTSNPEATCNAADGAVNFSGSEITTSISFEISMETGNVAFNPGWEFTFTLTSTTGASIENVKAGTTDITPDAGTYTVTGLSSDSGNGTATITLDVTGEVYNEETVMLEITSARELGYNAPAANDDNLTAVQIINAVPQTSEISTH